MTNQEMDEVRSARKRRAWYKRRDFLFIATVGLLWLSWEAYGRVTGPTRMTDALAAHIETGPERLNLLVTAKFPPERFHSNIYNEVGVQRGTEGRTTQLVRVAPSGVRWLSRQYWIDTIDLAPEQSP